MKRATTSKTFEDGSITIVLPRMWFGITDVKMRVEGNGKFLGFLIDVFSMDYKSLNNFPSRKEVRNRSYWRKDSITAKMGAMVVMEVSEWRNRPPESSTKMAYNLY